MVLVEIEALYHYKGMDKKLLSSGPLSRIQLRLVSCPPAFFVTQGAVLLHMSEDEFVLHAFDRAPSADIPANAHAIALNNEGSALSHLGRTAEAVLCFE